MHQKRFVLCSAAAVLALAIACSQSSQSPVSPGAAPEAAPAAAPDGSTLKVGPPTPVAPVNNTQVDTVVLVANKATGKFDTTINPSYEFQINNAAGIVAACTSVVAPGSGGTVTYTPTCSLEFEQPHTWRVRAVLDTAVGPWSAVASFRSPIGAYINGNEVRDPLSTGSTVGVRVGATTFIPGTGLRLDTDESRVTYVLPQNLQNGEFSVMVKGIDEGSPGDKSKVMSMQEGFDDLTTNDYRVSVEKRGRSYPNPGAVQFRIIMGDSHEEAGRIFDSARIQLDFSDERWYFWKFTWQSPGRAALELRRDSPTGAVMYNDSRGTGGFLYRPIPHVIHLGAPVGRAGSQDASIPGAIYKDVWVSGRPRPNFPPTP
jgi:hypothetical protein